MMMPMIDRNMLAMHQKLAKATGVASRELFGRARHRQAVEGRFAAFLVLRERKIAGRPMSTTRIARLFGRDHTTVADGIRRGQELMADPTFEALYRRVKDALAA